MTDQYKSDFNQVKTEVVKTKDLAIALFTSIISLLSLLHKLDKRLEEDFKAALVSQKSNALDWYAIDAPDSLKAGVAIFNSYTHKLGVFLGNVAFVRIVSPLLEKGQKQGVRFGVIKEKGQDFIEKGLSNVSRLCLGSATIQDS